MRQMPGMQDVAANSQLKKQVILRFGDEAQKNGDEGDQKGSGNQRRTPKTAGIGVHGSLSIPALTA